MKLIGALLFCVAFAQAQPAAMPLSVTGCGAINASNGTGLVLHGTIGQPGARFSAVANQELHTGFWGAREFARQPLNSEIAPTLPNQFALRSAYPNPFNPLTSLHFDVPFASRVKLSIFDVTGRKVATLTDGVFQSGTHSIVWHAGAMASGSYFARMETTGFSQTQQLHLIK